MSVVDLERSLIGRITLDAPPLNILTRAALAQLRAQLERLRTEKLRVLVLDAAGKHFSAGASVEEHLPPEYEPMIREFVDTVGALRAFPLPVIAAVRGRCLGGAFELVQAADLVIAAESASFGAPEIKLGVFPPVATALLPQLVGASWAAELVFTGDSIDAAQAEHIGLVHRVVPDDRLAAETLALAERIARHSAATLRIAKRALRSTTARSAREGMEAGARLYIDELMKTRDAVEGLNAFLGKRPPSWSDT